MYRSCSVCGRIHPEDKMCKRVYKKNTKESHFRNTNAWIKKRNQIKKRDKYLCQLCLKDNIYTYDNLQVHHIIPIAKDYNKKLDSDNLITLCRMHHEQVKKGIISKEELYELLEVPPEGRQSKSIIFFTPTDHLHLHQLIFFVSFLENKKSIRTKNNTQFF